MNNIQIVENLFPSSLQDEIESVLMSDQFPWFFNKGTIYDSHMFKYNECVLESNQFTHSAISEDTNQPSVVFPLLRNIMYFIEEKTDKTISKIQKIKCNLLLPMPGSEGKYHPPHWDHDTDACFSALYYVNDSDGDTYFFNKTKDQGHDNVQIVKQVTPKKGTCVIFDSNQYHASSNPIISERRVVVNAVFYK